MSIKDKIKKNINIFHSRYADAVYNIGIIPHSDDILIAREMPPIKWLIHGYNDRWFADPFIVAEDEQTYTIFVETYFYDIRRGTIGLIVADKRNFRLLSYKTILYLSTHLSFPCYFYEDGKLYVYPENSRSGCNTLYRFNPETEYLDKVKVQSDLPLTDAVAITTEHQYLTTTYSQDCNGNQCHVLKYDGTKYVEVDIIYMSDNSARGAGLPFQTFDGRIIRPAQNCNGGYGVGLVFQEVNLKDGKFYLKEINRLSPNDRKYNIGLHTYNHFGDVAIVDGYYEPNKFVEWAFKKVIKLI